MPPPPKPPDEDDRDTWDEELLERLREDRTWELLEKHATTAEQTRGSLQAMSTSLSSIVSTLDQYLDRAKSSEEAPTITPAWLRAWSAAWITLQSMEWWRLLLLGILALALISCCGVWSAQLSGLLSAVR